MNKDYDFVKHVLREEYADIAAHRYHMVRGVEAYGDPFLKNTNFFGGGIRGEFALYINEAFPDKNDYLF